MIKNKWIRLTAGTILGGFAGVSLNSSILPVVLTSVGFGDGFFIRWALGDYAAYSGLVWAVGGWSVAKAGFPKAGAIILGLLGIITGALLVAVTFHAQISIIVAGGVTGGVYGAIGGLLLGTILHQNDEAVEIGPED